MIDSKWTKLAKGFVGNKEGKHCHWCKHMDNKKFEGEVYCSNKNSKFSDNQRIRTWDGEGCAEECGHFQLDAWYEDGKNFDAMFKEKG